MELPDAPVNDLKSVVPVMTLSVLDWIALFIVIIGGLNWGLIGVINLDIVGAAFGAGSLVARVFYMLAGLAALYCITLAWRLAGRPR